MIYKNQFVARFNLRTGYIRDAHWPRSPMRRKPNESFLAFLVEAPVRAARWTIRFLTAPLEAGRLQYVYVHAVGLGAQGARVASVRTDRGLDRCDIRYVNLDHRSDRRNAFEREMRKLGISRYVRIPAIHATPGNLGNVLSHMQAIEAWIVRPGRMLLICEDDAEFVSSRSDLDSAIEEFMSNPALKVLALANRTSWHIPISGRLAISSDIQTTAAYVVKPESIAELLKVYGESVIRLSSGVPVHRASIDTVWKKMQRRHPFALPRKTCVIQRPGYSDIQGAAVNYYTR